MENYNICNNDITELRGISEKTKQASNSNNDIMELRSISEETKQSSISNYNHLTELRGISVETKQSSSSNNDDLTELRGISEETKQSSSSNNNDFSEKKVCLFFMKNRYCYYGRNCKFSHDKQIGMNNFKAKVFVKKHDESTNNSKSHFIKRLEATPKGIPSNKGLMCRYFIAGNCNKREKCPFQHMFDSTVVNSNPVIANRIKKRRVPICHYFKKGACDRGENCKFYHQSRIEVNKNENSSSSDKVKNCDYDENIKEYKIEHMHDMNKKEPINDNCNVTSNENNDHTVLSPSVKASHLAKVIKSPYNVMSLTEEDLKNLRDTEIIQLKRRYPNHVVMEENHSISFTFEPSDPDWPFDLKSLQLEVIFPEEYPIEPCSIIVIRPTSNIPEILVRHLNYNIKDWLEKRHQSLSASNQTELMFRPFLKWFDKNLEDLFIGGLKKVKLDLDAQKSGIEFVPVETLFPSKEQSDDCNESVNEMMHITHKSFSEPKDESKVSPLVTPSKSNTSLNTTALKQGIKVLFTDLEFVEGVAALSCTRLAMTTHCIRCKTPSNMKCTPGKNNTSKCSKCSKLMEFNFVPSVLHQFSSVAGNLYLIECQVMDINLVESIFLVDCLNCSRQVLMDGLHYGQKQKRWCMFCNEKLVFSIGSVKFQATSSTYIAAKNMPVKKTEKRKDPLIKEGEPLPDFGTCKHYKKSHRWLRFPCCGRLYPCDVCHDEKETDHEMKFASRMVCGFCSKEQPYNKEKPCISCTGNLTSKSGAHWEGGKGCRNKIKMSRDDKHKYVGTSKTVSKKAQSIKTSKKK